MAPPERDRSLAADDRTDARAVSITVNHVLAMGITSILMVGLFMSTGTFVTNQVDRAGEHELRVIGNRLAAEVTVADRIARRGGEATVRVVQPSSVASGSYTVEVLHGGACDTRQFTTSSCLHLSAGPRGVSVTVPMSNTTTVDVRQAAPGEFFISATAAGTAVDDRGGAGTDVGIDIGVGDNVSAPVTGGSNVSLERRPPVARFRFSPGSPSTASAVHFRANESTDPDGEITSYEWDLDGDGATEMTGEEFNYSYSSPGQYNVTLVVSDGTHTANVTKTIVVSGLLYRHDATAVDFRDADSVTGGVAFTMRNAHSTDVEIRQVLVDPLNDGLDRLAEGHAGRGEERSELYVESPTDDSYADATFEIESGGRIIGLDNGDYDTGGYVDVRSSDLVAFEFNEFHRSSGPYDVDMTDRPVDVAVRYEADGEFYVTKFRLFESANAAPNPRFDLTCHDRECEFDATPAGDPDGSIANYTWYVDGATRHGRTVNHTFSYNGTYDVTLTVTDDEGLSSSRTKQANIGAAGFRAKFNFQPDGAPTPAGYLKADGGTYATRPNGYTYGWNVSATSGARERPTWAVSDPRYRTFVNLDDVTYGSERAWRVDVPDGRYRVTVVMGDAYYSRTNNVRVEGTHVRDPDPSDDWDRYTAVVEVTDGDIEIAPSSGSYGATLAFVHIEGVDTRPFDASGGTAVMEAENFTDYRQGTDDDLGPGGGDDMNGTAWLLEDAAAASGGEQVRARPDYASPWAPELSAGETTNGPRLDYDVHFDTTGTYYVWLRVRCPDDESDSVHVGLDGSVATFGDDGFAQDCGTDGGYTWINLQDGSPVTLEVTSTGVHTVNVWLHETGVAVDKVVVTTDSGFSPTGTGPEESDRET